MLKSFSVNKVPGNNGLPVEFYKTFWGTLWELGKLLCVMSHMEGKRKNNFFIKTKIVAIPKTGDSFLF